MAITFRTFRSAEGNGNLWLRRKLGGASAKALLTIPLIWSFVGGMQKGESVPDFQFPVPDVDFNSKVDAYVSPMGFADQITKDRGNLSSDQVREFAKRWVSEVEAGKLKPLSPSTYEETVFDGVIGQVVRTQANLVSLLEGVAGQEIARGQFEQAAEDVVLLLKMTKVMRNADLNYNSLLDAWTDRGLENLKKLAPKLKEGSRVRLADSLTGLRTNGPEFALMIRGAYSMLLQAQTANQSSSGDECPNLQPLRNLRADGQAASVLRGIRASMRSNGHIAANLPFETTLSRTLLHDSETQSLLEETYRSLL